MVHWTVRQENIHAVMETEVFCRKADMLLVNYEAPTAASATTDCGTAATAGAR